ncbi:MAG: Lyzozyme M1 (1,4-beta-N-acetylmuramidase), partial [Oscillospiraceae bacterium]|nr:Lyzozyme M1 (1,4-beta-N-acetylmuramidase) [Oscillospiraceae bacterium]
MKTYTDASGRTALKGIDVSEWQGYIDWSKVKADGIQFAFIRAGLR